jgi:hypothetical protein
LQRAHFPLRRLHGKGCPLRPARQDSFHPHAEGIHLAPAVRTARLPCFTGQPLDSFDHIHGRIVTAVAPAGRDIPAGRYCLTAKSGRGFSMLICEGYRTRSMIASATAFADTPTSRVGPTQLGHPCRQGQWPIRSRADDSRRACSSKRSSAKPMPPG